MDPEDPDSDPDHSQNLIISSFYHFGHILKILSKSVHKFFSYLVHKQTNKNKQALRPRLSGNFKVLLQSTDNLLHYKISTTHLWHCVQIWPTQSSYCSALE